MSGRARYAAVLRSPHVAPLLTASMLARLPFGMFALALVLYLAEERDSFAVAGLVDGAFGIGAAVGAPLQSRLIDRLGQRRVLLPLAVLDAIATAALVGAHRVRRADRRADGVRAGRRLRDPGRRRRAARAVAGAAAPAARSSSRPRSRSTRSRSSCSSRSAR